MASAELRLIQRRIKSVRSTMKITRHGTDRHLADRAGTTARVAASQPYNRKMSEVIRNVAAASGGAKHLLETRPTRTAGVLVVTSDRGLAGAYNINVMRLAELRLIDLVRGGTDVRVYVVGKKAHSYFATAAISSSRHSSASPIRRDTAMPGRWPTC